MLTRVLVIDSNIEIIELLKNTLEPKAYELLSTSSGLDGIQVVRQRKPDVVILDLILPDMDGWQVCKEIRSFSQVPILVLSAINKPGMVTQALNEGADDYLLKPMPNSVLVAHLKKLVRRARAEQQARNAKLDYCI